MRGAAEGRECFLQSNGTVAVSKSAADAEGNLFTRRTSKASFCRSLRRGRLRGLAGLRRRVFAGECGRGSGFVEGFVAKDVPSRWKALVKRGTCPILDSVSSLLHPTIILNLFKRKFVREIRFKWEIV